MPEISQLEKDLYQALKTAFEEHERLVWVLEKTELLNEKNGQKKEEIQTEMRDKLQSIIQISSKIKEELEKNSSFYGFKMSKEEITGFLQRLQEKEVMNTNSKQYPAILNTAIVNSFMDDYKEARSSVLKSRLKKGSQASLEEIIKEADKKNTEKRSEIFHKYKNHLGIDDIKAINAVYLRRILRHSGHVI
jgi:hypothetical protein